jgi:hypothetical protein
MRKTLVLVVLALVHLSGSAGAQPKKDPAVLFNEAAELAEKGRLEEAVAIWLAVEEDIPLQYRPVVLSNLGLAYKKLKHYPEAWYYLDLYLSGLAEPDPAAQKWRAQVEEALVKTHAKVRVTCDEPGAHVRFSAEESGPAYDCPLTWWLVPGKQVLRASKPGYKPVLGSVEAVSGKEVTVALSLAAVTSEDGVLEVRGDARGVQVFLDGRLEGKVPFVRKLPAGTYELMVGPSGKVPWKKTVTIAGGQTVIESPDIARAAALPEEQPRNFVPTVVEKPPVQEPQEAEGPSALDAVLLGGGIALAAAGGVLHALAYSSNQALIDEYPDGTPGSPAPASYQRDYDRRFDDEVAPKMTAAWILYGAGAATAITGAVLLVLDLQDGAGAPAGMEVTPMPVSGGAGVDVGFEF